MRTAAASTSRSSPLTLLWCVAPILWQRELKLICTRVRGCGAAACADCAWLWCVPLVARAGGKGNVRTCDLVVEAAVEGAHSRLSACQFLSGGVVVQRIQI